MTTHEAQPIPADFVLPDYNGGCVSNIVPALLEYPPLGDGWMPTGVAEADQVVLLVLDGLGWHQLADRQGLAPTLAAGRGGAITTVAPTTTAAALTSITTGVPPGEHGVIGYKVRIGGETLNVLRWTTGLGDARDRIVPGELQQLPSFGGRRALVVNRREFATSGFTMAHLAGTDHRGYGVVSTMVHEVAAAVEAGERFVYAYYDGLDRVGHERGHHDGAFDAEFAFVDRLVADVRAALPDDVALIVTADHGQVHTGDDQIDIASDVLRRTVAISGEERFVWLHAEPGGERDLLDAARSAHGDDAWVLSFDEARAAGLFGAQVSASAHSSYGDVAMIATRTHALVDPRVPKSSLIGRHGSLTSAEVLVPLLAI